MILKTLLNAFKKGKPKTITGWDSRPAALIPDQEPEREPAEIWRDFWWQKISSVDEIMEIHLRNTPKRAHEIIYPDFIGCARTPQQLVRIATQILYYRSTVPPDLRESAAAAGRLRLSQMVDVGEYAAEKYGKFPPAAAEMLLDAELILAGLSTAKAAEQVRKKAVEDERIKAAALSPAKSPKLNMGGNHDD